VNPGYRFPAEVRMGNAPGILEEAIAATRGAERVYDLADCHAFDSSLIAVLVELLRLASASSATCRFESPTANLLKLSSLYGVGVLLFGDRAAGSGSRPLDPLVSAGTIS
jgi:ABC-type transporter Mla MlaB component